MKLTSASLNDTELKDLSLQENKEIRESNLEQISIKPLGNLAIGSLEFDIPLKIVNAKILNDNEVNINCLVKWKQRDDGTIPDPDWISSKILKVKCPMVLFDFYESRIKFPKKDEE